MKNLLFCLISILLFASCQSERTVNNHRVKSIKMYDVTADTLLITYELKYNTDGKLDIIYLPYYSFNYGMYHYYDDSIILKGLYSDTSVNAVNVCKLNTSGRINELGNYFSGVYYKNYYIKYKNTNEVDSINTPILVYNIHDTSFVKEFNFQYQSGNCTNFKYNNANDNWYLQIFNRDSGSISITYENTENSSFFPMQHTFGMSKYFNYNFPNLGYDIDYLSWFTIADNTIFLQNKNLIQSLKIHSDIFPDNDVIYYYRYTTLSETETKMEIFRDNILQYKCIVETEAY